MRLPVVALPLTLLAGVCAGVGSWPLCWALIGRFGWLGLRFNIGLRFGRWRLVFGCGIDELE